MHVTFVLASIHAMSFYMGQKHRSSVLRGGMLIR